jgi:lysophospholipid acyltransferase (LPLAT)-like uncharacterized protein
VRLFKRLTKSKAAFACAAFVLALYLRFVFLTSRLTIANGTVLDALQSEGTPYIPAFWHGRMVFLTKVFNRYPGACVLISNHRDGELIARVLHHMGIAAVRGSAARQGKADKGGAGAFREMLRRLKSKGAVVGITPDGPRGPRMRAAPGVIRLAEKSKAPIIACTWSGTRCIVFKSWDRLMLPLPFCRAVAMVSEPIRIADCHDDGEREAAREALEATLNRLTQACDAELGRALIEPAPASQPAAQSPLTSTL